jgi:transposase
MRMNYPAAVLEKAKRLEQLLKRVAVGESPDEVNEALGFNLDQEQLARAQAKYEAGGCRWEALIDGRFGHEQKAHSALREWLYARKAEDEEVRAPQLAMEIKEKFKVELSAGHINYLLRKRGLSAPPGRPEEKKPATEEATDTTPASSETVDNAGTFFPGGCEGRHGSGGGG